MLKLNLQGNNIQQNYRRCPFFQSRLDKRQSAATTRLCCLQCLPAQEEKSRLSQLPFAEMASTASSHDAQRPWDEWRWNRSSKRSRASQTQWRQFLVSSVWATWRQRLDVPAALASTCSRDTPCNTRQGCLTPHKWTIEMPHRQRHTELAQRRPACYWHRHSNDGSRPQPHGRKRPCVTSSGTPKCEIRVLRNQGRTVCEPSLTEQLDPDCVERFHWESLTERNDWSNMWQGVYTNVPEDIRDQPKRYCATRQRWHLLGWLSRQIARTGDQPIRNSHPVGAHRRGTQL